MTLTDMLKELPQYGEKLGLKMEWDPNRQWLEISELNDFGIIAPNISRVGNAPGKEMLREALVRLADGDDDLANRAALALMDNHWGHYTTENVVRAVYEAVR